MGGWVGKRLTEVLLGVGVQGNSDDITLLGVGLGVPEVEVEALAGLHLLSGWVGGWVQEKEQGGC